MKKISIILILVSMFFRGFALDKSVKLNSGNEMPILGLGTWTLTGKVCEDAVYAALKNGYRLIDTAKYYGNESEVGNAVAKAVKDGICKCEEVFITTKIVPWSSNPEKDIEDSLVKLQVRYIDLVLLHQSGGNASDDKVYAALVKYCKAGKIKSIGISNFYTKKSVEHFVKNFDIPPAVVQNENHIFYQNTKLQSDIAENFDVFDFELTDSEMAEISKLNTNRRYENW